MGPETPAIQIEPTWKEALASEFAQPYFQQLIDFIKQERAAGKTIYPAGSQIFHAFALTPLPTVRVVLLGQDPYHGRNQAHGLAFSVPPGITPPPSLVNIFKEMHSDVGADVPRHGNLESWARQGVLLLNASLTVRAGEAGSHQKKGWEAFTDAVIRTVAAQREHVVFILWGKFAQAKRALIDESKHKVLTAAHPSPYSADTGFFGSKPFSQTNAYLIAHGQPPIDWAL